MDPRKQQPSTSASTTAVTPTSRQSTNAGRREFNQFLSALDDYSPTYPEALSTYYLQQAGFSVKDERIAKLVSLAADKVIANVLYEAKQISLVKQPARALSKKRSATAGETFEPEDLETALGQNQIFFRRKRKKGE